MLDGAGVVSRWGLFGLVCALGLGTGGLSGQSTTGGADAYVPTMTQTGLKLASSKASLQFLVIDHVDRPSEN